MSILSDDDILKTPEWRPLHCCGLRVCRRPSVTDAPHKIAPFPFLRSLLMSTSWFPYPAVRLQVRCSIARTRACCCHRGADHFVGGERIIVIGAVVPYLRVPSTVICKPLMHVWNAQKSSNHFTSFARVCSAPVRSAVGV